MSCSKQHGPQAFIGFIVDSTGETISQDDWHDLRQLADELDGDTSRSQVSAAEAIATLKQLDARLKADKKAAKAEGKPRSKTPVSSGDSNVDHRLNEMRERSEERAAASRKRQDEMLERIRGSFAQPSPPPPTAAPKPAVKPTVAQPVVNLTPVQKAEQELMVAKVTRGTLTVMKMFIEVGVKPLLELIRQRREENREAKRVARRIHKQAEKIRNKREGHWLA